MGKGKGSKRCVGGGGGRLEVVGVEEEGPWCPHGPMLAFRSERGRFYACSCCRRGECVPNVTEEEWARPAARRRNLKYRETAPRTLPSARDIYLEASDGGEKDVDYCTQCDSVRRADVPDGACDATHPRTRVPPAAARAPSAWLPPLASDTTNAQYHFTQESLGVIVDFLLENDIERCVCVGTPSVHEAWAGAGRASLLLDLDARYAHFCDAFLRYNMFNHHALDPRGPASLARFLDTREKTCLVIDPPFGGRLEPLAASLRSLSSLAPSPRSLSSLAPAPALLPTLLVFPYFAEQHVVNLLPELRMHHYEVTYRNQGRWSGSGGGGSPVRVFSSVCGAGPRGRGVWCGGCAAWVRGAGRHCAACGCDPRPGDYVHCGACGRCVKRTYAHCDTCGRCARPGHTCGATVTHGCCYECKDPGHKRADCPLLAPAPAPASNKKTRLK